MLNLPDTLWVLLTGFASKFTLLYLPKLSTLLRFLQLKWSFLNYLVNILWSSAPSSFSQVFSVAFMALWPCQISWITWLICCDQLCLHLSHNKYFWLLLCHNDPKLNCSMFICVTFKSHMKWSAAQFVSAPTSTILPIPVGSFHSLNVFSHVIYTQQTSMYQKFSLILGSKNCGNFYFLIFLWMLYLL